MVHTVSACPLHRQGLCSHYPSIALSEEEDNVTFVPATQLTYTYSLLQWF